MFVTNGDRGHGHTHHFLNVSEVMKGQCGLLFTDCKKDEVLEWFNNFSVEDYARSGFKVNKTVKLKEGPLKQFAHSLEPYLRQLGMPTKLDRGIVTLLKNYVVCKKGNVLTPEQAKILELLEQKLATFKVVLKARWSKSDGFETLGQDDEDIEESDDKEIEEEEDEKMEDD